MAEEQEKTETKTEKKKVATREIRCRNCGAMLKVPEYHGPHHVACKECEWEETLPPRRPIGTKLDHLAGSAYEAHQKRGAKAREALKRIRDLSPAEFERFCADLFREMGHEATVVDQAVDPSHLLEFADGNEQTFVQCKNPSEQHKVSELELDDLRGAMRARGAVRGIFLTTGGFADQCAESAKEANIELMDGEEVQRRIENLQPGALASWWE
jgi:restriction endonuclease Mrr